MRRLLLVTVMYKSVSVYTRCSGYADYQNILTRQGERAVSRYSNVRELAIPVKIKYEDIEVRHCRQLLYMFFCYMCLKKENVAYFNCYTGRVDSGKHTGNVTVWRPSVCPVGIYTHRDSPGRGSMRHGQRTFRTDNKE